MTVQRLMDILSTMPRNATVLINLGADVVAVRNADDPDIGPVVYLKTRPN